MGASESAEIVVKMALEGMEVALKLGGVGLKNLVVMLYAMSKEPKKSKGRMTLNAMIKSGSPLKIFSLKEDDLKKFNEESKKFGFTYTLITSKNNKNKDGMVDIMVKADDMEKVNYIIRRFQLSSVNIADIKSEIKKDKIDKMIEDAQKNGIEVISNEEKLVNDIIKNPNEKRNPKVATTEKSPLSELSLENKSESRVASKNGKPSVREELNNIKKELQQKQNTKEHDLQKNKIIKNKRKKRKGKVR